MKKIAVVLLLVVPMLAWGQQMKSLEFRNQDIRDILLALGELNSVSIVPDETVDGKASYVFSNMDFEQALRTFLDSFRLSYVKKNNVYYISKLNFTLKENGSIDLSTTDTPLRAVIRALSTLTTKTILFDNLPNDAITINIKDATLDDLLKILTAKYPDFNVVKQDKFYYIKSQSQENPGRSPNTTGAISRAAGNYNLKIDKGRFKDLLLSLFSQEQKEFLLLLDRDLIVENIQLKDKSFDEALKVLLLYGNADYNIQNGIYYIYEVQRRDLMKKFMTNIIVGFDYISSSDFLKLLPANLNSGTFFKLDDKGNKLILSGSMEEIKPIWDFVLMIDKPSKNGLPLRVDLNYIKTDELFPLLPTEFATFNPLALPGKTSFIISIPPAKNDPLLSFVKLVDRPTLGLPVKLRYIKSDDLLAKLPPSVADTNLVKTNDPSLIFFKGTLAQRQNFLKDLEEIDVPRSQIRYEILVLQFGQGNGLTLSPSVKVSKTPNTTAGVFFSGDIAPIMNLGLDIVSNFGYLFGVNLSAQLSNNTAKVVADTTINGLSGEKISFQNTNTTRFTDNIPNPDTGKTTPVVRELSSGLILSLEGWVSADNMITLKIDSTLSKQTGNTTPPNSSEKKISTQIRTLSGKPLIISGLKQEDLNVTKTQIPILGDIPLIGFLFQGRTESLDRTEFSIYIVPILERPENQDVSEEARLSTYYRRLSKVF